MTLARKVDRLVLKREKKMLVAELHVSTSSIGGDVRTLGPSNKSRSDDIVVSNDAIAAGAASIADIVPTVGVSVLTASLKLAWNSAVPYSPRSGGPPFHAQ